MGLIVVTDCDHPTIDVERAIFQAAGHEVRLAQCRTAAEIVAAGRGSVGLLAQYAPIDDTVMAALLDLRVIGRYGVGLDNIDLPAAARRGIRVLNVPDYCTGEVADHALGLILALTRGIVFLDRSVQAGRWDFRIGGELRRAATIQLGIVGFGRIGQALARRALALGYRVVATDPRRPPRDGVPMVELVELLSTSDVVSLHPCLDETTRHLLDARAFALMKPGAFLVNTARGGLVDQAALVEALRSGRLGGAALDVLEQEPIPAGDPLLALPNVILTPHTAFYSRESLVEMKRKVAEGMVAVLEETP
ncbi:MAG: C-terminal binding protein [Candidatus Limnocylindrales bacterium]|jgi:D-3-phosphoglycerate dehydrogenase